MSVVEALRGIAHDIQTKPTLAAKVTALRTHSRVLGAEILGIIGMVPFATQSYLLYRRLAAGQDQIPVTLTRDLRYGPMPRNRLDVYRRARSESAGVTSSEAGAEPIVLFVHGGVWASGSKWHYAKMASRLAEEGITTCVAEYTLFPEATTDRMAEEVGLALDWVVDNCVEGQNKKTVVLVGHSAGAHLCAMTVVQRSRRPGAYVPAFVGIAGVYDIARHYDYEESRNVHHLSTMKRAVGGPDAFAGQSPAVLLRQREGDVSCGRLRVHLMASRSDVTVPHLQSVDLHDLLLERGCPEVTLSLYDDVGHGDFIVEWVPRERVGSGRGRELPPHAAELVETILSSSSPRLSSSRSTMT